MTVELDATLAAGSGAACDDTATDIGRPGAAVASAPALGPGAMLAHFRIEGLLGKGGMGEVYRATDLALDRQVALKVLPAAVAAEPMRRERLFREARSQARLQHPNVCHIYYVGQQDGVVFFAMELVCGHSLAERLATGPMLPEEAIEVIRQAALGLREAQRHGFTHRDVKPSNLMCDREGRVKVVDFGLVKVGGASDDPVEPGARDATGLVGTPLYMAPEQASGEPLDLRADIYALGATLHHLVSGRPPFDGTTVEALATQHGHEPRPRLAAAGRRGRELAVVDTVVARMMAKRPGDRFESYDQLIGALDRISPTRTRPAGFFVRALAVLIDLMFLGAVAGVFTVVAEAAERSVDGLGAFALFGMLYGVIVTARWGGTLGRGLLDLEVTAVAGQGRPSLGASAVRHLIEYGPFVVGAVIADAGMTAGSRLVENAGNVLAIIGVVWGLAELARAALRSPDRRAAWDRVAGTMVRYRVPRANDLS